MKPGLISKIAYPNNLDHMISEPQNHGYYFHHQPWTSSDTLDRYELSDWVEHITKHLIDDDVAIQPSEDIFANSSAPPNFRPKKIPRVTVNHQPNKTQQQTHNNGEFWRVKSDETRELNLMTLLMESAVAISIENFGEARQILHEIAESASPHAPSCAERVVAYFAEAMSSRVVGAWLERAATNTMSVQSYQNALAGEAFRAFDAVSPLVKLVNFASNQAIVEAVQGQRFVHVIDLDAVYGMKWHALLRLLATRTGGPPESVRLTAIGPSPEALSSVGRDLAMLADRLGIAFEFNALLNPVETALHVKNTNGLHFALSQLCTAGWRGGEEAVAVHWLRHGLYNPAGPDAEAMDTIRGLRPRIFTLVEQDILSSGGGSFLDRFVASLHYYSTMFDSLGACLGAEDPTRHTAESRMLYGEVRNVLAGQAEEKPLGSWRRELSAGGGGKGLAQVAMSGSAAAQAQLMASGTGFSVAEGEGCIRVGWKGTSLYTVSAWTSCNANANAYLFSR